MKPCPQVDICPLRITVRGLVDALTKSCNTLSHNRFKSRTIRWYGSRNGGPAMHRNVEVLIGRLATNPGLRRRFAEAPLEALREQGLELTEVELMALAATDPDAFRAIATALDARLKRASSLDRNEVANQREITR